jgi:hypothetical protein
VPLPGGHRGARVRTRVIPVMMSPP